MYRKYVVNDPAHSVLMILLIDFFSFNFCTPQPHNKHQHYLSTQRKQSNNHRQTITLPLPPWTIMTNGWCASYRFLSHQPTTKHSVDYLSTKPNKKKKKTKYFPLQKHATRSNMVQAAAADCITRIQIQCQIQSPNRIESNNDHFENGSNSRSIHKEKKKTIFQCNDNQNEMLSNDSQPEAKCGAIICQCNRAIFIKNVVVLLLNIYAYNSIISLMFAVVQLSRPICLFVSSLVTLSCAASFGFYLAEQRIRPIKCSRRLKN